FQGRHVRGQCLHLFLECLHLSLHCLELTRGRRSRRGRPGRPCNGGHCRRDEHRSPHGISFPRMEASLTETREARCARASPDVLQLEAAYIMSPIPPGIPPAMAPCFSGASATIASVVRMFFAIEAAFCSAERVTMVGSMITAFTRSSYSPVSTFRPCPLGLFRILSTTTEPSRPALSAS